MAAITAPETFPFATAEFTVPETVVSGVPFDADFVTFAGGCYQPSREEVEPRGDGLRITAYDKHISSDACPARFFSFERRVRILLSRPGEYVIELRGLDLDDPDEPPISVERVVTAE